MSSLHPASLPGGEGAAARLATAPREGRCKPGCGDGGAGLAEVFALRWAPLGVELERFPVRAERAAVVGRAALSLARLAAAALPARLWLTLQIRRVCASR